MKYSRLLPLLPLVVAAACDTTSKEQLTTLARVDSIRRDSLIAMKSEILDDVLSSTQFMNEISSQLSKAKSLQPKRFTTQVGGETEIAKVKADRTVVVGEIQHLVAKLDSVQTRLQATRTRARSLAKHDSTLTAQLAAYENTIADFRQQLERQKAEFQAVVDKQTAQIASLSQQVDTITKTAVRLSAERAALTDTVGQLTTEKNTAYYVIGTKDELIKKGVLVQEGRKRFIVVGGRPIAPARELDTTVFTRIDRTKDRLIAFPEDNATYTIFSRQNPTYAAPLMVKDGKLAGGLRIEQPERFWEPSKFLILVRS